MVCSPLQVLSSEQVNLLSTTAEPIRFSPPHARGRCWSLLPRTLFERTSGSLPAHGTPKSQGDWAQAARRRRYRAQLLRHAAAAGGQCANLSSGRRSFVTGFTTGAPWRRFSFARDFGWVGLFSVATSAFVGSDYFDSSSFGTRRGSVSTSANGTDYKLCEESAASGRLH
jgi:hypothetical protein